MEVRLSVRTIRWFLIGITILVVIGMIINGLNRRSKYMVPPLATSGTLTTADTTLAGNVSTCETVYSDAVVAAGGSTTNPSAVTALATLNTCISANVSAYVTTMCPYTNGIQPGLAAIAASGAVGNTPAVTASPAGGPVVSGITPLAWSDYQAAITTIRLSYDPFILNPMPPTSTTDPTPAPAGVILTDAIVRAARKADLTGATRKYLSTVCPSTSTNGSGFYTPSSYGVTFDATTGASTPTTGVTYPDTTSAKYNSWIVLPPPPALPSSTSIVAPTSTQLGTYGFYSGYVTRARIAAWAVGSGDAFDPTTKIPASGLLTPMKYTTAPTTGPAAGIPNWVIARDFGPGTFGTAIPVSYVTPSTPATPTTAATDSSLVTGTITIAGTTYTYA